MAVEPDVKVGVLASPGGMNSRFDLLRKRRQDGPRYTENGCCQAFPDRSGAVGWSRPPSSSLRRERPSCIRSRPDFLRCRFLCRFPNSFPSSPSLVVRIILGDCSRVTGLTGSYSGPEVRFADITTDLPEPRFLSARRSDDSEVVRSFGNLALFRSGHNNVKGTTESRFH